MPKKDLEHSGILGMRWGRRNGPPYPLGKADMSRRAWNKLSPEEKAARAEGEKQYLLKSGTATDVATKLRGHLTNEEYADVLRRLDYEQKLMEVQYKTDDANWIKAQRTIDHAKTVHQGFNAATDIYNDIARVTNLGGEGTGLPLIPDIQRINTVRDDERKAARTEQETIRRENRQHARDIADANRDRLWRKEDADRNREWAKEDAERNREWAKEDAERNREWNVEDATTRYNRDRQTSAQTRRWNLEDEARRRKQDIHDYQTYGRTFGPGGGKGNNGGGNGNKPKKNNK